MKYIRKDNLWYNEKGSTNSYLRVFDFDELGQERKYGYYAYDMPLIPKEIYVDDNNFLHNEEGPAIIGLDDIYYWHGILTARFKKVIFV